MAIMSVFPGHLDSVTHVDEEGDHDFAGVWQLEFFHTGDVEYQADGPTRNNVEQSNKAEEELHINP